MAPPCCRAVLLLKVLVVICRLPLAPDGLKPSTCIAPPKPPPLDTFDPKKLSLMLIVLERPWIAPPALLIAVLLVNLQLTTLR